jgi:hypothetical protein
MPTHPPQIFRAGQPEDGRRTIIAVVSAAIISAVVLAVVLIFDVK